MSSHRDGMRFLLVRSRDLAAGRLRRCGDCRAALCSASPPASSPRKVNSGVILPKRSLPDIVGNTIVLLLGVGLGTGRDRHRHRLAGDDVPVPGVGVLQWALLLPLVLPTYIIGYAYADLLAFAGPLQTGLRGAMGWSRAEYWFPDLGSAGRRRVPVHAGALPLCLSRRRARPS